MPLPRIRRARRLAAIGGVAALASLLSYASQASPPDRPAGAYRAVPVEAGSSRQAPVRTPRWTSGAGRDHASQRRMARSQAQEKSAQTERQVFGQHIQPRERPPSERMPFQSPVSQWVDTAYDHADPRANILQRPSVQAQQPMRGAAAATSCSSAQFASLSGAALVAAVRGSTTACINELFSISGAPARATFAEARMVTVANALRTSAQAYAGDNRDGALQLILFLRAGYYVQFYDSGVGDYGSALRSAIRGALDAFASNANFGLVNDTHGEVLAEYMTLIDSATENARYLYVVKRLLGSYSSGFRGYYWMQAATNNAYSVLFRGHQNEDFRQTVQADPSIVDTLYGFANAHFGLMGTEGDYLVANAARELGRFLRYTGTLKSLARSRTKVLLDRASVTGSTARLWVGLGEMVDHYDAANCSYYGLCDFRAQVEAAALPIRHTCGPTLKIRAQAMTASQLAQSCEFVGGLEGYFHDRLRTGGIPVADDHNTALEMVVFDSSTDYGTYAGALFGIDTNNGGMYLEGDPSAPGNQARFIAYEAEWLQPERFEIWNLAHEYIHYLDGRYNMHGDFADAMSANTVWWVEGLAEYLSYTYRDLAYVEAQREAAKASHDLSTIHANNYSSGATRIYNWGYLAVRYMFEQRASQVDSILARLRPGDYSGYTAYMASIGRGNDAAFKGWLPCVADPSSPGCGAEPALPECEGEPRRLGKDCSRTGLAVAEGHYNYLYLHVPQGTRRLRITTRGGSGNADLYVNTLGGWASREWHNYRSTNGDNVETVTVEYPPAGYVYLSLYGRTAASGVTVTTEY